MWASPISWCGADAAKHSASATSPADACSLQPTPTTSICLHPRGPGQAMLPLRGDSVWWGMLELLPKDRYKCMCQLTVQNISKIIKVFSATLVSLSPRSLNQSRHLLTCFSERASIIMGDEYCWVVPLRFSTRSRMPMLVLSSFV